MNTELIKKLKNNEAHVLFGDMTEEEQECIKGLKKEIDALQFLNSSMLWQLRHYDTPLLLNSVYRINPSYVTEPEKAKDDYATTIEEFKNMPLHSERRLGEYIWVYRVPNGWIYYNNEFGDSAIGTFVSEE